MGRGIFNMNNKFRIIVPSYNNENWVEYNIASILNQTYKNYEVVYIDDNSTDNTWKLVNEFVGNDTRFKLIRNPENKGAMFNYMVLGMADLDDETILVHLDGDDWLIDIFVLEKLNEFYNRTNCLMTYGGMYVYNGSDQLGPANPQNSKFSDFTHEHQLYRKDVWRASHLRTYRSKLLKAVSHDDMIDPVTNDFYWEASDLSFQFPCLEMAGKNKIGVVDFPTYTYNASPINGQRTSGRQHSSRHHEIEEQIRHKKHYKIGTFGEKLPQLNVIGYNLEADYIPTNFTIVNNKTSGEFDITLVTDLDLIRYINGEINPSGKVIADLHECRSFSPQFENLYNLVRDNSEKFHSILTHDEELLKLPNAELRLIMWKTHLTQYRVRQEGERKLLDESVCRVYDKSKQISCVSSNKAFLPGHIRRLEFVSSIKDTNVDFFGVGTREIAGKIDALRDYRFSVAIENDYRNNWMTEKLSDCFWTGTIPIYYGAPNVGELFNINGIITFNTQEELQEVIKEVELNGEEIYNKKKEAILDNFERVKNYSFNLDEWFDKYIARHI